MSPSKWRDFFFFPEKSPTVMTLVDIAEWLNALVVQYFKILHKKAGEEVKPNGVCVYAVNTPGYLLETFIFFNCANIGWPYGPTKITHILSSNETNFHANVISLLDKLRRTKRNELNKRILGNFACIDMGKWQRELWLGERVVSLALLKWKWRISKDWEGSYSLWGSPPSVTSTQSSLPTTGQVFP